ncbi:MAG TPA: hypothetical protein VIV58_24245, partial [Kofleriaceae bacterium]
MRMSVLALGLVAACAQAGSTSQNTGGGDDASTGSGSGSDTGHVCTTSCDDSNACTTDTCDNGTCAHTLVACDDADACTTDACDAVMGCTHVNNNHGTMTFSPTGTIQTFAVPSCVSSLHILAAGAQGGGAPGTIGGLGATLEGDFAVAVGQNLSILVGGAGTAGVGAVGQRGGT